MLCRMDIFAIVFLLLQATTSVHVRGLACEFRREEIEVEGNAETQVGLYLDLDHPLSCSGSIVAWNLCYYPDNSGSGSTVSVYLRVYRNESDSQMKLIHQTLISLELEVTGLSFECRREVLDVGEYLSVQTGDYLAAYTPDSAIGEPLQVVGKQFSESVLYRDSRPFGLPFMSEVVPFSDLARRNHRFLHLHADVVSQPLTPSTSAREMMPTPNPGSEPGSGSGISNGTDTSDGGGMALWEVAVITTFSILLFVLTLLLVVLATIVVVCRRWKVGRIKKDLLEIHPAHLAIDNATYDLPMLRQDYRLFRSTRKGKAGGHRGKNRASTSSENIYESPYDEGITEVFGIYATLAPSSAEFRSTLKKVVSTLSKVKPTPYQIPAAQEEQIYEQISGQRVPSLSSKHIQTVGQLGSGEFANVEKAVWSRPHGIIEVAVKTLHSDASPTDKLKFLQEGAITSQFRHPNVVFLYGIITDKNKISLVMEYISKGDMKGCLLEIRSKLNDLQGIPKLLLSYGVQVALGMLYLSDKGFVHRDLAARNILVSDKDVCKIADFGMSRDLADAEYYISEGGTIPIRWTAPEAVYYRKYSTASDVWSYGCVLYEIWSLGHKPFESCSNTQVLKEISIGFRLPPPPGCPHRMYDVMSKCWHPHHTKRPSFGEALRSLLDDEETVLDIPSQDAASHDSAGCLGAELQAGHKMYRDLQALYIPSNASISQRPPSTTPRSCKLNNTDREASYDSIDVEDEEEDGLPYLNVHQELIRPSGEEGGGEDGERYENMMSQRNPVEEALYDKIKLNGINGKGTSGNKEEYYNVVTVDRTEDKTHADSKQTAPLHTSTTKQMGRNGKPPLKPRPVPRNIKCRSGGEVSTNELGDYFESEESTLTINNDQVVV